MPQRRIASLDVGRPASGRWCARGLLVMTLALWAATAVARSAPDLERLDLTVRPSDVAAPPRAVAIEPLPPIAAPPEPPSDPVGEIDKVGRTSIPRRGNSALGPLGSIGGEEGGMLQELLENKTIPLFRVRMKSPL